MTAATDDWRKVPIVDNGEALVDVRHYAPDKISSGATYFAWQIPGSLAECYVRDSVARRLARAAQQLPNDLRLYVFDGWRPVTVQRYLFDQYQAELHAKHPDWPAAELLAQTQIFVSFPNTEPSCPSPHLTGGAVDLTLIDTEGRLLDMGSAFDEFSFRSHTDYFSRLPKLSRQEHLQRDNRQLLLDVLGAQGLSNYPEEWWHFDYGNQFWASRCGQVAVYGVVEFVGL
ncbi:M15 family metallopeptidase [Methylomonas paludis]|uniref:D-alanyl-D-alanine dipeptidase n=1 Tax=Methylomonas paludis TaxID=1173101 RepID=A0A975RAN7_9GAMM|nr:M15 family metallopeptidase [Methylomonas paludis]QWF71538.1 M15 family metallopeptidase [Methylomonas paludis]